MPKSKHTRYNKRLFQTLTNDDFNRQFYIFTGKGGVGKTAVSLGFARKLAAMGKRTLWVEMTDVPRATDAFTAYNGDFEHAQVRENLWLSRVTLQPALEEYMHIVFKVGFIADRVANNKFFQTLTQALPGMDSLVMLGKLEWELGRNNGRYWDAVVLDAPATGHALTMLRFPAAAQEITPVGPVYESAKRIQSILRNTAQTALYLVTLGEELPVTEVTELHKGLQEIGYNVAGFIANGLFEADPADAKGHAENLPNQAQKTAFLDRCDFLSSWYSIQQREMERLHEYADNANVPVHRLPFIGGRLDAITQRLAEEHL